MKKMLFTIAIVLLAFLVPALPEAMAADGIWTADSDGNWSDVTKWNLATVADGSGSNADFSTINITADRTVHLDTARTIGSLHFGDLTPTSAAGWTLDNNATPADILTISGGTKTITVDALGTGKTAAITAIIAGTDITKAGAGTLVLSGANTNTGVVTLTTGTLRATTSAQALGTGAATLSLGAGTILELANDTGLSFSRNTTITGNTTIKSERLANGTGVNHTLGTLGMGAQILTVDKDATVTLGTAGLTFGAVTLSAGGGTFTVNAGTLLTLGAISGDTFGFTVNGAGDTNITGVIGTTTGTLAKAGAGTLTLTGANTYQGIATITAGTLQVGNGGATGTLGTGAVVDNSALKFKRSDNITIANAISGSGTLEQAGAGTLTMNTANTYSGDTTVSAGTLKVGNSTALGTGNLSNSATLDIGTTNVTLGATKGYTQAASSVLDITANSASDVGKITTGTGGAAVAANSTANVTVGGYIANKAVLTIIDTGGSGYR